MARINRQIPGKEKAAPVDRDQSAEDAGVETDDRKQRDNGVLQCPGEDGDHHDDPGDGCRHWSHQCKRPFKLAAQSKLVPDEVIDTADKRKNCEDPGNYYIHFNSLLSVKKSAYIIIK